MCPGGRGGLHRLFWEPPAHHLASCGIWRQKESPSEAELSSHPERTTHAPQIPRRRWGAASCLRLRTCLSTPGGRQTCLQCRGSPPHLDSFSFFPFCRNIFLQIEFACHTIHPLTVLYTASTELNNHPHFRICSSLLQLCHPQWLMMQPARFCSPPCLPSVPQVAQTPCPGAFLPPLCSAGPPCSPPSGAVTHAPVLGVRDVGWVLAPLPHHH